MVWITSRYPKWNPEELEKNDTCDPLTARNFDPYPFEEFMPICEGGCSGHTSYDRGKSLVPQNRSMSDPQDLDRPQKEQKTLRERASKAGCE